ncbi:MAG: hypothetical protein K6U80_13695 [Firmicutes bacterium]|nr:hypothetical protein [Bacillota bacterium]
MKFIAAIILAIILFILVPAAVLASPNLSQAESGVTLPPSGLEFSSAASFGGQEYPFDFKLSYGAFPSVTIVGELKGLASPNGASSGVQKLFKVLWSPKKKAQGYTVYLGYDLDYAYIPFYGVSLWADYKYLLAFLNVQTTISSSGGNPRTPVTITPGLSLKSGSKWQLSGELEINPGDLRTQMLRLGMDYSLLQKVRAKLTVQTKLDNLAPDFANPVYQTGVTVRL